MLVLLAILLCTPGSGAAGDEQAELNEIRARIEKITTQLNQDKARKDTVEAVNKADQYVYQAEKALKEHGDLIDDEQKKTIQDAIEKLNEAKTTADKEKIDAAVEALSDAQHELAKAMYDKQAAEADASAAQAGPPPKAGPTVEDTDEEKDKKADGEEIIDADYEVKDE